MTHIQPQVDCLFNPSLLPTVKCDWHNQPMVSKAGEAIRAALSRIGRTQGWLAEQAGVSDNAVSKWIKTGKIASANVPLVARLLGIEPSDLLPDVAGTSFAVPLAARAVAHLPHYGEPVSDEEAAMLRDLRELLVDRREHYANEIRAEANVARAYKAMGLANPSPVPDEQVAEHLPPAPAVPPVERRHGEDRRVLFPGERRHVSAPNNSTPQQRSRRAEK